MLILKYTQSQLDVNLYDMNCPMIEFVHVALRIHSLLSDNDNCSATIILLLFNVCAL